MDLTIHRPQGTCLRTGRPFLPGETFYSALVRDQGTLGRVDVSVGAWEGPPAGAIAWWRSRYPDAAEPGPSLAPVDVLLDALEGLDGRPDDAALRYLLALQLVRRRVLRIVDAPPADTGDELVLACRRRECEYRVRPLAARDAAMRGCEERLAALLWSGAAA